MVPSRCCAVRVGPPHTAGRAAAFAALTRLIYVTLGAVIHIIAWSYDTSSPLLLQHLEHGRIAHDHPLLALSSWDTHYFWSIAINGYTYEQQMAFYPGTPLLARTLASLFPSRMITNKSPLVILFAGVTISFISFVGAVYYLYSLTEIIFNANNFGSRKRKSHWMAQLTTYLYCVNPAGLFLSAFYTESPFAFFSFFAMYHYEQFRSQWNVFDNQKGLRTSLTLVMHFVLSVIGFSSATLMRSNGLAYTGFFAFLIVIATIRFVTIHPQTLTKSFTMLIQLICLIASCMVAMIIVALPLIIFQIYSYERICEVSGDVIFPAMDPLAGIKLTNYFRAAKRLFDIFVYNQPGGTVNFRLESADLISGGYHCELQELTTNTNEGLLPVKQYAIALLYHLFVKRNVPYSYIQDKYWNVGFLRYWSMDEIGNFIVATPILIISILGLITKVLTVCRVFNKSSKTFSGYFQTSINLLLHDRTIPYHILWLFLTITLLLFLHVQIIVRLFTSIPCLYWCVCPCDEGIYGTKLFRKRGGKFFNKTVAMYFGLYSLAMTCLFATFYPPA